MDKKFTTDDGFQVLVPLDNLYFQESKALVTFTDSRNVFSQPDEAVSLPGAFGERHPLGYVPTNEDDDLPTQILETTGKNEVASACLDFKTDVLYGAGVKYGYIEYDDKGNEIYLPQEIEEIETFFELNDVSGVYSELIEDVNTFGYGFTEFILNAEGSAINRINHKESAFSRYEVMDPKTGKINTHFYSAKWGDSPKEEEITATPHLDLRTPAIDLMVRFGKMPAPDGKPVKPTKERRFVQSIRIPAPGRIYYPKPKYYSAIESGWMDFGNSIPEFKKAIMQNTMFIAWHVQINRDYFPNLFKAEGLRTKEEQTARLKKEFADIKKFLSGKENAGKTTFTYFKTWGDQQVQVPEIKFERLENTFKGGEYIEDSHEASSQIYTAFRVHPNLIGVIPGKTSSNLSGTDKRELLRIAQSLQKRVRDLILKPLYTVKRFNGWDERIKFWIPDIILTTLDQGKETDKTVV